jgi:beta propeller repeat protein
VTQIWSMDLDVGLEEPVSPSDHAQFLNAIDGNRIVWTELRYGNFDIFMFTVTGTCGDGVCNLEETCESCPGDCGACPPPEPYCGDTTCNGEETCESCPGDCGACPVIYEVGGFYSPIDNLAINIANAGKTIPVKWHLSNSEGDVSNPLSFWGLFSYPVSCSELSGSPTETVEEYSTGSSGLQYIGDGFWQYNWKTSKSYSDTCRKMFVAFNTGQISSEVTFKFN